MRSEAPVRRRESARRDAATGAPAQARTVFRPMARRRVLLPDMLDPLTIQRRLGPPMATSLGTHRAAAINGCLSPAASKLGSDWESNSGKVKEGCSKAKAAIEESASNCPTAASHRPTAGPD